MKEKCFNHPQKNALSICHTCGKYYCDSCLLEGKEFYYCFNQECQLNRTGYADLTLQNNVKNLQNEPDKPVSIKQFIVRDLIYTKNSFKSFYFKASLIFTIFSLPIFLFAFSIISSLPLNFYMLWIFTLVNALQSLILNFLLGNYLSKKFVKTNDHTKIILQNDVIASLMFISVSMYNLDKLHSIGASLVSDGGALILLVIASIIGLIIAFPLQCLLKPN